MNSIGEIIPGINGNVEIVTEAEIAVEEARYQDEIDRKSRSVLEMIRVTELSTIGVPRGTIGLLDRKFDPSLQPTVPMSVWREIADCWMNSTKWITLIGPAGVGKTDVAVRMLWKKRLKLVRVPVNRFLFVDAIGGTRELSDRYGKDVDSFWDRIDEASYIVIDDVGHALSDRHLAVIRQIIMSAEKNGTQLIITSNLTASNLERVLQGATMSRIMGYGNRLFTIAGRDVRTVLNQIQYKG